MKIFTSIFEQNSKLLSNAFEKGHQLRESIYFSFSESVAYLFTQRSFTRISFLWEKESKDEVVENFLTPFESFRNLCSEYSEVFYKDGVFSNGDNSYEFPSLKEVPDVSVFKDLKEESLSLLSKEDKAYFNQSVIFASDDEKSPLHGVFIKNNRVLASNRSRFYESPLSGKLEDISIPLPVAKLITMDTDSVTKYSVVNNLIHFNFNDQIDMVFSRNKDLTIPDSSSKDFVSMYDHEEYLIFKKDEAESVLKSIRLFLKDAPNQRIFCEFTPSSDGTGKLEVKVTDTNKVKKVISILGSSKIKQTITFCISASYMLDAVRILTSEHVKMQINPEMPAINFSSTNFVKKEGYKDNGTHIILVQLKD